MSDLRKRTAFLLIDHRRIFNQNPSKRALMDHIKELQARVDDLDKIVEGGAPAKHMPVLQVDAKVLVWPDGQGKTRKTARHFSNFENGKIRTFDAGLTSWTSRLRPETSAWDNWELAE